MQNLIEEFKRRFEYRDGALYVKESGQWKGKVGDKAGHLRKDGRIIIQVYNKRFFEHQVIWMMFRGDIPEGLTIDHIDCDPTNNKLENLRLANHSEQGYNRGKGRSNTSGYKGVSFRSEVKGKPWRAVLGGKHLGYFTTAEEAARAYNSTALDQIGEFARINKIEEEDGIKF